MTDAIVISGQRNPEAQHNLTIILDCSGSMLRYIDEKSKFDHLLDAIAPFKQANFISFSSRASRGIRDHAGGSTDMADAFRLCTWQPLATRQNILLISDGLPDDEYEALAAAELLETPVNVIYIGCGGDRGEAFMRHLAEVTKGSQVTVETAEIKLLGLAMNRLLAPPQHLLP